MLEGRVRYKILKKRGKITTEEIDRNLAVIDYLKLLL